MSEVGARVIVVKRKEVKMTELQKGKKVYYNGKVLYIPFGHCDVCEGNIYEENVKTCEGCVAWLSGYES
jgi:hypothetical protein